MPPNKTLETLVVKVHEIDQKLEQHLIEGNGVKADIAWLKKLQWLAISASLTTAGAVSVSILTHLLNK